MATQKREYVRPEVIELGSLADLTRGAAGSGADAKQKKA